jgi:hypothetical protein
MAKFLVETISMFRIRYVIEDDRVEYANDPFVIDHDNQYFQEFSQEHIDELITSTRQIDDSEYLRLFNEDNQYLMDWSDEQKFSFVNPTKNIS